MTVISIFWKYKSLKEAPKDYVRVSYDVVEHQR
jgi:hypothetical protein